MNTYTVSHIVVSHGQQTLQVDIVKSDCVSGAVKYLKGKPCRVRRLTPFRIPKLKDPVPARSVQVRKVWNSRIETPRETEIRMFGHPIPTVPARIPVERFDLFGFIDMLDPV